MKNETLNENCIYNEEISVEFDRPIINTLIEFSKTNNLKNFEKKGCNKNYGCSVCGGDNWCGTDGCPLDPQ
jgi:hypothetical protein